MNQHSYTENMEKSSVLPPPPELGWYPEDAVWLKKQVQFRPSETSEPTSPVAEEGDDWDSTVLSQSSQEDRPAITLRNALNGQVITVKRTTLLGRKPSLNVPVGTDVAVLVDSTRTVSRDHACIEYGEDGSVWIRDLGSLNGTYVIENDEERQVREDEPLELHPGAMVRIGDEFYEVGSTDSENAQSSHQ